MTEDLIRASSSDFASRGIAFRDLDSKVSDSRIKPADHALLRDKQKELEATASSALKSVLGGASTCNALQATLIFAQHEVGTAVCIHPEGWVLTCVNGHRGRHVLALLKIITIEPRLGDTTPIKLAYPGYDNLELSTEQKTTYNLSEVSQGRYRGLKKGTDPQDNWNLGALMHDACMYWGHLRARLVKMDGTLCGLHSSWDDQTAMRHGIPLAAIQEILKQQTCMTLPAAVEDGQPGSSILVPRSPIR